MKNRKKNDENLWLLWPFFLSMSKNNIKKIMYRKFVFATNFKKSIICTNKTVQIVGKHGKMERTKNIQTSYRIMLELGPKSFINLNLIGGWYLVEKKVEKKNKKCWTQFEPDLFLVQNCFKGCIRTDLNLNSWKKMYV